MAIPTRLRRTLEARFAGWVRRRQGDDTLPVAVHRRRLYILPTQAGVGFALLLFGMLLAGLNYANSLALLVTFLLGGLMLVAMHLAHRNLLGARVVGARVEPAFAGDEGRLEIVLDAGAADRIACAILWRDSGSESTSRPVDALRGGQATAALSLPAPRRGVYPVGRIRVSSTWPFGFFRVWTWLHLPLELIVYPAARGTLPRDRAAGSRRGAHERPEPGDDEWQALRAYRDGDAPRRIAWKAWARGAPLLVGEYAAEGGSQHEFSYDSLAPLPHEVRLEQLCRWIVDAVERGEPCALHLPGVAIAMDSGARHRHRCLAALARSPA
ncbi:MAG: DUF58 domain-containing protein [Steroidobacteraceae bacterium]